MKEGTRQLGSDVSQIDMRDFQKLLTAVAKAVLAQGGPRALAEWESNLAARWGQKK
jgi:hypothetical protein